MNDAELYQKSNKLQKRDTIQCLDEYAMKIKWKNYGDRVIDIGCGDGSVTTNILKLCMPGNFKKLVGCDISEKMVHFANGHHGNERTTFTVLDIGGELPEELKESFDHVFSFYTLHWVKRQRNAFTNIYNLLAEGGDCLLTFLGHMPVFDAYRILSRKSKWNKWLKDVDRYVSPYHDSPEPEKEIITMMKKIGFTDVDVKRKERSFVFDCVEDLKKAVTAVNPFNIPKDMNDEFLEDYLKVVQDMRLMDKVNNNFNERVIVKTDYTLLIAYGSK